MIERVYSKNFYQYLPQIQQGIKEQNIENFQCESFLESLTILSDLNTAFVYKTQDNKGFIIFIDSQNLFTGQIEHCALFTYVFPIGRYSKTLYTLLHGVFKHHPGRWQFMSKDPKFNSVLERFNITIDLYGLRGFV